MKTYFISGIGTDIGKSYVTGILQKQLIAAGITCSTFKLVQTGSTSTISPDIQMHRELAQVNLCETDQQAHGICFAHPCSPHLAAALEGQEIDGTVLWDKLQAYEELVSSEIILCEGAGGIFVPLNSECLTIDWVQEHQLPIILVCHAGLGSIHMSIATLEALKARHALPEHMIYNPYPNHDALITHDSQKYLKNYITKNGISSHFWDLNELDPQAVKTIFG